MLWMPTLAKGIVTSFDSLVLCNSLTVLSLFSIISGKIQLQANQTNLKKINLQPQEKLIKQSVQASKPNVIVLHCRMNEYLFNLMQYCRLFIEVS